MDKIKEKSIGDEIKETTEKFLNVLDDLSKKLEEHRRRLEIYSLKKRQTILS